MYRPETISGEMYNELSKDCKKLYELQSIISIGSVSSASYKLKEEIV